MLGTCEVPSVSSHLADFPSSCPSVLLVWMRDPLQPAAISVHLGDSTLLPCGLGEVRHGLSEAGLLVPLRWTKDGKDVLIKDWVPDGRVALLVDGDLLLLNSTWEDAGRYRCLAGTGRTTRLMSDITLTVLTGMILDKFDSKNKSI